MGHRRACRILLQPRRHSHLLDARLTSPSNVDKGDSVVLRMPHATLPGAALRSFRWLVTDTAAHREVSAVRGGCTDPCPADRPGACGAPLVCCTAGSVCGRDCNAGT